MRIWSLDPKYLDPKGLVALWRESLLCQKVLRGETKGYKHHPQVHRFRNLRGNLLEKGSLSPDIRKLLADCNDEKFAVYAISFYLDYVHKESESRGYHFDHSKISYPCLDLMRGIIPVTKGQVQYEMKHLLHKLRFRDPKRFTSLVGVSHCMEEEEDKMTDEAACQLIEEYVQNSKLAIHPLFELVDGDVENWEKVESFAGKNQSSASSLHTGDDEYLDSSSNRRKRKMSIKRSKGKKLKRK
jgi:hypothetical protein